jgi:hypothetical protein
MPSSDCTSGSSATSYKITPYPANADAWAMPAPIVPAPITETLFMLFPFLVIGER